MVTRFDPYFEPRLKVPTMAPFTLNETFAPTSMPTAPPTFLSSNASDSSSPIGAPTEDTTLDPTNGPQSSSQTPTSTEQAFGFDGLEIRLEGAREITLESRLAFERVTESFYKDIFLSPLSSERILQQNVAREFSSFDTKVVVTGASFDTLGSTITYDQFVSFVHSSLRFDKAGVRDVIMDPFSDDNQTKEYIERLQQSHEDFKFVSSVQSDATLNFAEEQKESPNGQKESRKGLLVIIFAIVGALFCCCCCGGTINYWLRDRRIGETSNNKSGPLHRGDQVMCDSEVGDKGQEKDGADGGGLISDGEEQQNSDESDARFSDESS